LCDKGALPWRHGSLGRSQLSALKNENPQAVGLRVFYLGNLGQDDLSGTLSCFKYHFSARTAIAWSSTPARPDTLIGNEPPWAA
jgi:hypothetical protein